MNESSLIRSALADAAEANFVTHAGWLQRRVPGMRVIHERGLMLIDSGLPCDTFNVICHARLEGQDLHQRARAAIAYFQTARRPFSWWVGPTDTPATLGEALISIGLERVERELAMAADLELVNVPPKPGDFEVKRVTTASELRAFAQLSAANWTPPDEQVVRFYELAQSALLAGDCPLRVYLGYLDGQPVATAELTIGGGVIGLYNISTLREFRKRGFGSAMTIQPLLEARREGHRMAILQAAPDGVNIYARAGFKQFGEITEYKVAAPKFA